MDIVTLHNEGLRFGLTAERLYIAEQKVMQKWLVRCRDNGVSNITIPLSKSGRPKKISQCDFH